MNYPGGIGNIVKSKMMLQTNGKISKCDTDFTNKFEAKERISYGNVGDIGHILRIVQDDIEVVYSTQICAFCLEKICRGDFTKEKLSVLKLILFAFSLGSMWKFYFTIAIISSSYFYSSLYLLYVIIVYIYIIIISSTIQILSQHTY